jgi:AraC-like DNA-binding protein
MQSFVKGYTWNNKAVIAGPRISSAIEWCKPVTSRKDSTHQNPFWILDYTLASGMQCRINSAAEPFKPRNSHVAHLYAPFTKYWENLTFADEYFHETWITFWGAEATAIEGFTSNRLAFASFHDPCRLLEPLFQEAVEYGKIYGDDGYWKAQSVLFKFFDILVNFSEKEGESSYILSPEKGANKKSAIVNHVQSFIKANLNKTILLEDIADALNVSVSLLSHSYSRETGESPMRTHARFRMMQVKNMLLIGDSLKAIAEEMGFCDIYHLSKFFKKHEGFSPRAFLSGKKENTDDLNIDMKIKGQNE